MKNKCEKCEYKDEPKIYWSAERCILFKNSFANFCGNYKEKIINNMNVKHICGYCKKEFLPSESDVLTFYHKKGQTSLEQMYIHKKCYNDFKESEKANKQNKFVNHLDSYKALTPPK